MKIGVVGTGAMGSVYAGLLAEAGHEVWAVDLWKEHLEAIRVAGLRVSGASGDRTVAGLHVADSPAEVGPCDIWVIATKAAGAEKAAQAVSPLLGPETVVMAFQNGLGSGERIATHIPPDQILIGVAEGFGSHIPAPGHVHHSGMRLIRIGEMNGGMTERLARVEQLWTGAGFPVRAFADINTMVWEKFLCNVTLSAPCTVFDVNVGDLMADPQAWAVALGCAAEAHRVGVAKGVAFGFEDPIGYVTEFAATIPDASPSMRLDHLARRPSEIDVLNGMVVTLSAELGLAAPYNQTLVAVVARRERDFAP